MTSKRKKILEQSVVELQLESLLLLLDVLLDRVQGAEVTKGGSCQQILDLNQMIGGSNVTTQIDSRSRSIPLLALVGLDGGERVLNFINSLQDFKQVLHLQLERIRKQEGVDTFCRQSSWSPSFFVLMISEIFWV